MEGVFNRMPFFIKKSRVPPQEYGLKAGCGLFKTNRPWLAKYISNPANHVSVFLRLCYYTIDPRICPFIIFGLLLWLYPSIRKRKLSGHGPCTTGRIQPTAWLLHQHCSRFISMQLLRKRARRKLSSSAVLSIRMHFRPILSVSHFL